MTAVEINDTLSGLIEMFSSVQNTSIMLNSSLFANINITGMLHNLVVSMCHSMPNRACWWCIL